MNAKVMPAPIEDYKKLIEQDFPAFKVERIKYLGSGWDNAAILVNDKYVFRFPRGIFEQQSRVKTDEIEKEVNILNYLQGKVAFNIPEPKFIAPGFRYVGYRLIPGTLWDQVAKRLQFSDELLKSWVKRRSEISAAITVDDAPKLKIPVYRLDRNDAYVNEFLSDENAEGGVKELAAQAKEYVHSHCGSAASWQFIHEDLQMSNCMVDVAAQEICGVIDWGEAEVGPVEAEFFFWSKYGPDVVEKMAKLQQEHDGTIIDTKLVRAIHIFYIVADYVDFKKRGFNESARHKWQQIEAYL